MLRRVLPWLGVVALVVAAVVTAGWGDTPAGRLPSPQPSTSPVRTPTAAATSMSSAEAHSLTRNASLRQGDLPTDFVRVPSDGGYGLDRPSVVLCGGHYSSENYRLAAHRVVYRSRAGEGLVENVVVVFERGHADQALAEIEAAAPRCTREVPPSSREQPDTLALRVLRPGSADTARRDLVVERRGEVLSVLRVDGRQGYLTLDLARRLGNRLEAQLP